MKKLLPILLFSFLLTSTSFTSDREVSGQSEAKVYVCTGKYAKRYHDYLCEGIENCKGEKVTMTKEEAKKKGLTPCRICYK